MRRGWAVFKESVSCQVFTKKIVVMIVKPSDIDVEILAEEPAVSELITIELFRREIRIGIEAREKRRSAGRRAP